MAASSSSSKIEEQPPQHQVFINFRGEDLRFGFVSHLVEALENDNINVFIDNYADKGEPLETLLTKIEESRIALAIFSMKYTESTWCLRELAMIKDCWEKGKLVAIPIFYKLDPFTVRGVRGQFGDSFRDLTERDVTKKKEWKKALKWIPDLIGITVPEKSPQSEILNKIVMEVKKALKKVPSENIVDEIVDSVERVPAEVLLNGLSTDISSVSSNGNVSSGHIEQPKAFLLDYEMEQRLKQLEEKLDFESLETQIVGIVGMPGIGKTTLAEMHFKKWKKRFLFNKIIRANDGSDWLKDTLLNGEELNHKAKMFTSKIFVVLDDVSHKNQVKFLLENLKLIKKGSKIVITTRDKSTIAELVRDTYMVPRLNDKEALEFFKHHAFNDHVSSTTGNFMKLSEKYVDYAEGNPLALEELGKELCGEDEAHWETRLATLPHCCNPKIRTELRISYEKLTEEQKDAFLDISCFFRSEEEDYVNCLLGPYGSESCAAVKDLVEKLLICISAGRIEMHNLLCTFGQELRSSEERMWNHEEITNTLRSEQVSREIRQVRGIFLDTSKFKIGFPIHPNTFIKRFNQRNLRYLKVDDSLCRQHCDDDSKVYLPDGLEFPFQKIRYLHWLKFPLDELPQDFNPENLIDLRLPYSKIKRVWEAVKETPWLKWVDLSYSTNLTDLSALSMAFYLQRLNLEGCTVLDKLPREMNNMKSLVFLNLRGCVMLSYLPEKLDLVSLKTLILSGCSNFINFELLAENLEFLYLDGTAIENLPRTIQNFQKLVVLNLKDCKMLDFLPGCLDKLKALEELILSGCAMLRSFPDIKENMENLQILRLDGTIIEELPNILLQYGDFKGQVVFQRSPRMNGLSMLRRLCLSRNDMIYSLQSSISQLYHLKWIDLMYCNNLWSISTLPPNLQCLDAHACNSLKEVASPLALMPTQQIPCSFIFTNCEKLEHVAKNEIICYAHNKSRMISEALNRHNKGLAFEALVATCFPGTVVPPWFSHSASGAVLHPELPRHWSKSGFVGIALCAIVSFKDHIIQNNNLQVKCICEFKKDSTSSRYFNCHVGGLSETGDEQRTIKSTHVFIGYTNWLNINKFQEENGEEKCVIPTKASITFEVTDGTGKVSNCEILKCGFSLVFESSSWEASSRTEDLEQGEK